MSAWDLVKNHFSRKESASLSRNTSTLEWREFVVNRISHCHGCFGPADLAKVGNWRELSVGKYFTASKANV